MALALEGLQRQCQDLASPFSSCVALSKSLTLSEPPKSAIKWEEER